jgi:hypothetical protein
MEDSHSIIYEYNTNDGLVFDKGKWVIKHNSTKIENNQYVISITFIKNNNKSYDIQLYCPIDNNSKQKFVNIKNTFLEVRINKIILNLDFSQTVIIEIKNENKMDLSCYQCRRKNSIQYTYFKDNNNKSFCSSECLSLFFGPKRDRDDDDESSQEKKKKKITPYIELLYMGEDHGEKENLLNLNFIKSLNYFSTQFNNEKILVKQLNNQYNINDRKPFLIFWESEHINSNSIDISNINGKDSLSWKLPSENDSFSCFQWMDTAIYLFLYPINFDINNHVESFLDKRNNESGIGVQKYFLGTHGQTFDDVNTKIYGFFNPFAMRYSFNFIIDLFDSISINGEENLKYLEIILPNTQQCHNLVDNLREITYTIIQSQLQQPEIKKELDILINNHIKKMDGDYQTYYNMIVQEKENLFKNRNIRMLFSLIKRYGDLSSFYNLIKSFILFTWSNIISHVRSDLFNEIKPFGDLELKLNENKIIMDKINNQYFISIIENLKNELSIDLPSLLFNKIGDLFEKGLLLSDTTIRRKDHFTEIRDFIVLKNMLNICLSTNIKRCIIFGGNFHIKHFRQTIFNQTKININMESYSIFTLKNHKLFDDNLFNSFSKDTHFFLEEIRKKILLYIMYEKIDEWLWRTEQLPNQISQEDSDGKHFIINTENYEDKLLLLKEKEMTLIKRQIKSYEGGNKKLQFFSNLIGYYHGNRPNRDLNFNDNHYFIVGLYIYSIIYSIVPSYKYMINNYVNQYNYSDTDIVDYFKKKLLGGNSILPDPLSFIEKRKIGETVTFKNIPFITTNFNVYDIFNK